MPVDQDAMPFKTLAVRQARLIRMSVMPVRRCRSTGCVMVKLHRYGSKASLK
jgi:hypothetical protein